MKRELEHFNLPTCKKCGGVAELERVSDGACGDPECCGSPEYYINIKCPKCDIFETVHDS